MSPSRKGNPNSPEQERQHIVRVIHSHPIYLQWFRDAVARAMMAEAQRLTEGGHDTAGAQLAGRALAYRTGDQ